MNRLQQPFESRFRIYRRAVIGAFALALILRFTIFLHSSPNTRWAAFLVFMLGTWLSLMVVNGVESQPLRNYFQAQAGPRNIFTPFKTAFWFHKDSGDPYLEALKLERRRLGYFMVKIMFGYPLMAFVYAMPPN